jgi:hypothetical protein
VRLQQNPRHYAAALQTSDGRILDWQQALDAFLQVREVESDIARSTSTELWVSERGKAAPRQGTVGHRGIRSGRDN